MLRPLSGSSMMRLFSITPPTVAFSVFRVTAAADTSTVSATFPTSSLKSCRTCAAVSTRMPLTVSTFEALHFDFDFVIANLQRREAVVSAFIRMDGARNARARVGQDHGGARNHGAGRIRDQALN